MSDSSEGFGSAISPRIRTSVRHLGLAGTFEPESFAITAAGSHYPSLCGLNCPAWP